MFIVFGMRKKSPPPTTMFEGKCYHCKNDVQWLHLRATDWLEFFFIPLIPFGTTHFLACSICGDGIKLDAEEGRGADNFATMDEALRLEWREYLAAKMEDHQLDNLSETQRNWYREQHGKE